jgi:NADH-quinone oxidoreductase subunit C
MDGTALVAALQEDLGVELEVAPTSDAQTTIYLSAEALPGVARVLRDRGRFAFDLLAELTAVDYWPRQPRFEVVYVLVSIANRMRLRVKVRVPGVAAHVATVTGIWPAANWLEREVWDLFGIVFDGHPDPRRLLMPEDWEGYPLRKDYPVQIKLAPKTSSALQVSEEQFRANMEKDRLSRRS